MVMLKFFEKKKASSLNRNEPQTSPDAASNGNEALTSVGRRVGQEAKVQKFGGIPNDGDIWPFNGERNRPPKYRSKFPLEERRRKS